MNERRVCVICARSGESAAVLEVFKAKGRLDAEPPDYDNGIAFTRGTIGTIEVIISNPLEQGGEFTASHVKDIVHMFDPRLVLMTGVCAGLRGKTRLGDLFVAKASYNYAAGKHTDEGHQVAPTPIGPRDEGFLAWVHLIMSQNQDWMTHPVAEPTMLFQTSDLIKRAVFEYETWQDRNRSEWLWEEGFDLTKGISENSAILGKEKEFDAAMRSLISSGEIAVHDGKLCLRSDVSDSIRRALLTLGRYPFENGVTRDPKFDSVIFGSGPAVRSDTTDDFSREEVSCKTHSRRSKVFAECLSQHRDTVCVDMESSAFYTALRNEPSLACLVIKAVADHADHKKNDGVHEYGKQLAASFALELIQKFRFDKQLGSLGRLTQSVTPDLRTSHQDVDEGLSAPNLNAYFEFGRASIQAQKGTSAFSDLECDIGYIPHNTTRDITYTDEELQKIVDENGSLRLIPS